MTPYQREAWVIAYLLAHAPWCEPGATCAKCDEPVPERGWLCAAHKAQVMGLEDGPLPPLYLDGTEGWQ